MLFEVETKDYIKVNVDDIDVLIGAQKILKKLLSESLRYEYESFYRSKGRIFGRNEFNDRHDLEQKWGDKLTERDKKLINLIIDLGYENPRSESTCS